MNVALYKVSLCMGISDNIKVIAVTLNETTILEIKVMISLPFQSNQFTDKVSRAIQSFCFVH